MVVLYIFYHPSMDKLIPAPDPRDILNQITADELHSSDRKEDAPTPAVPAIVVNEANRAKLAALFRRTLITHPLKLVVSRQTPKS